MAAQAALIADTIAGMKRAISKHEDPPLLDEPYLQPGNRGNKLKRNSDHLDNGDLLIINGPRAYRRDINYAGFQRSVLSHNPRRYDEEGEELSDSDSDEEADARAREENPYAQIRLETLLLPLVSAASLPDHPSLSVAYTSPILTNMTQHACEMAQRERKTLSNAKYLTTKLRGDHTWAPCGLLYSDEDEAMFNTEKFYKEILSCRPSHRADKYTIQTIPKAKAKADIVTDSRKSSSSGIEVGPLHGTARSTRKDIVKKISGTSEQITTNGNLSIENLVDGKLQGTTAQSRYGGIDIEETVPRNSEEVESSINSETREVVKPAASGKEESQKERGMQQEVDTLSINGEQVRGEIVHSPAQGTHGDDNEGDAVLASEGFSKNHLPTPDADEIAKKESAEAKEAQDNSQPVLRRMQTRAQAQAASEPSASSRNDSPDSWVPPRIHPLFKIPDSAAPDKDYGLPSDEAHETRRLLTMYVQKQEEICRGAERLHNGLLQADRQRKMVLKWCKAEGHVGEMSDGEDWYDKDEWGLEEDLVKGHDDEDGDVNAIQGKKTRGRRA